MTTETYYSHGKLLLSAEYAVLEGAMALALPLRSGQKMEVAHSPVTGLQWVATHPTGEWFRAQFDPDLNLLTSTQPELALPLANILRKALSLSNSPANRLSNLRITTALEFDPGWGWGSSSTFIHNLASWLNLDPYSLLAQTFGGSGYDIACASAEGPLFYQRSNSGDPVVTPAHFSPPFLDQLWVIYLNRKQNSQKAILAYERNKASTPLLIEEISTISREMAATTSATTFGALLSRHEAIIQQLTGLPAVQEALFPDFSGLIKSLGAWGGDFILGFSQQKDTEVRTYFQTKGFKTTFKLNDIILNKDGSITP